MIWQEGMTHGLLDIDNMKQGPQVDVSLAAVLSAGWKECYRQTYDKTLLDSEISVIGITLWASYKKSIKSTIRYLELDSR